MPTSPTEISLELKPRARYDLIDVTQHISERVGDLFHRYRKALYCSFHTTAGYLEESQSAQLSHRMEPFIGAFQQLFPREADYRHDQLQLRTELTEAQKRVEPRNADSHLVFISSGMKNCVTYENRPDQPVYFIDLDGLNGNESRCRKTTILGFNHEEVVHESRMSIPVSKHPIDSIKLSDSRHGFFEQLNHIVRTMDIEHGRVDIILGADEQNVGLTVNEYETLLMKHDLAEVVHNPLKFMAQKGKHALAAPQLIPGKTLDYAKYDLVQVFNELMDKFGVSETVIEKFLSIFLRLPASRFLSMKRHISLLVSQNTETGHGEIVFGKYQSPILVQWQRAPRETRYFDVKVSKFN